MGNLNHDTVSLDMSSVQYVRPPEGAEGTRTQVQPDDILISITAELGMVALVPTGLGEAYINQHIALARAVLPEMAKYLAWFLASDSHGKKQLNDMRRGATKAGLGLGDVRGVHVPLPPLAEQRRIVDAIEQQFTRLDAGVAALKRAQAALKRYRAAVLKAAVEGKLTETWRVAHSDIEPVALSRARLIGQGADVSMREHNARHLWGAGYVSDAPETVRAALPDTWELCKVRNLGVDPTTVVQVGPMSMKSSEFAATGVPVLNVGCVRWGHFDLSKLDYLPEDVANRFLRYRMAPGDVVFTRSGTVGRCAIITPEQDGWLMTFHLLRARVDGRICLPKYLTYVLEGAPYVRAQIESAAIGSTRAGFNTRLLEELDVALPPPAEQEQIVAEVEERLSIVGELEAAVEANLKRADRLRQSILERAFSGQLVPQDPNDEPASMLLERIKSGGSTPHGLAPPELWPSPLAEQKELWS